MLYLEDYLEMIEHLPQELRDRFTEMRELDLTVQNSMDVLEKKTRVFFLQCKKGDLQGDAMQQEYQSLRKEYYKVMEDADEKVNIASQTHDLVERYLRRLDSELFKFKCELEADNNGITEILEKRSLEMDNNSSSAASALLNSPYMQKENRYFGTSSIGSSSSHLNHSSLGTSNVVTNSTNVGNLSLPTTPTSNKERYRIPKVEKRRESGITNTVVPEKRANVAINVTAPTAPMTVVRPISANVATLPVLSATNVAAPSAVTYNLQQIGSSATNAIAAAASQAIVATQQMQQGRRTASLKASYEAIHGATRGPAEFWTNSDIANAASAAAQITLQTTSSNVERKHKKRSNTSLPLSNSLPNPATPSSTLSLASSPSVSVDSLDMISTGSSGASASVGVPAMGLNSTASTSNQTLNRSTTASSTSTTTNVSAAATSNVPITDSSLVVEQTAEGEWSYDPNEPRYCTCNQVSYGDMVACDNDACPFEWFHYPCVGITQPPKGKWYCPKCTASMRRRNRKN